MACDIDGGLARWSDRLHLTHRLVVARSITFLRAWACMLGSCRRGCGACKQNLRGSDQFCLGARGPSDDSVVRHA